MSAALTTVLKESFTTLGDPAALTDDQLANVVIDGVKKFRHYLPYVFALKARFVDGERDSKNRLKTPIKDCYSWSEFCEQHLDRTTQAIGKALAPKQTNREEIISPVEQPQPAPAEPETIVAQVPLWQTCHNGTTDHWISKENYCPTGKRGFDYPDEIWQLMRAEGTIGPRDFIAYIGRCGQCGRCHRDKDQSGHEEGGGFVDEARLRHRLWYRPDELNQQPEPAEPDTEPQPALAEPEPEPVPQPKSRTAELRDGLQKQYPLSELRPSEKAFRNVAGRARHRTDRWDITLFNLHKDEIKAIGELLGAEKGVVA